MFAARIQKATTVLAVLFSLMNAYASEFVKHASSPHLSDDQAYTIELLIERARHDLEPYDWDASEARSNTRQAPGYRPKVPEEWVEPSAGWLEKQTWLSLQRINTSHRPVRALDAVGCLANLSSVFLSGNDITDLTPLEGCRNLRSLDLSRNAVIDLSPLAKCTQLKDLSLHDNPITDLSILDSLPNLQVLAISSDQLPGFKKAKFLPRLRKLQIHGSVPSFRDLPAMPDLRVLWGPNVDDLSGLEKFTRLENLVNFSGDFNSLEPLAGLKALTHVNLSTCKVTDLRPLLALHALRELWIGTGATFADLSPLDSLPLLHEVTVKQQDQPHPNLKRLRSRLTSWDVEFLAEAPRHIPSLKIETVSQEEFDKYDGKESYGLLSSDENEALLTSELDWLDQKLEEVFALRFKDGEDYTIPSQWGGARSRTVMLMSQKPMQAFPQLVLGIQRVLARAKKDWIIYFQSDGPEFIVWVYPDKIVVGPQHVENVRRLIMPK